MTHIYCIIGGMILGAALVVCHKYWSDDGIYCHISDVKFTLDDENQDDVH